MGRWETTSVHEAEVSPAAVWEAAFRDATAWPRWGRLRIVELEPGRLVTAEARLPGARLGHRHLIEPAGAGSWLENTVYLRGPLSGLWARVIGRRAQRALPERQRGIATPARR